MSGNSEVIKERARRLLDLLAARDPLLAASDPVNRGICFAFEPAAHAPRLCARCRDQEYIHQAAILAQEVLAQDVLAGPTKADLQKDCDISTKNKTGAKTR